MLKTEKKKNISFMMAVHHSRCRSLPYSKAATHRAGESQLLRLYTLMLPPRPPLHPPLLQRDPLKDDANKTRLSKKKKGEPAH